MAEPSGMGTVGGSSLWRLLSDPHTKKRSERLCLSHSGNRAGSPACGPHMSQPAVTVLKVCVSGKPFPAPPLFIICGYGGNVRKPQMAPSTPSPAATLGAKKEEG